VLNDLVLSVAMNAIASVSQDLPIIVFSFVVLFGARFGV
jgi:hypothetical protein